MKELRANTLIDIYLEQSLKDTSIQMKCSDMYKLQTVTNQAKEEKLSEPEDGTTENYDSESDVANQLKNSRSIILNNCEHCQKACH